MHAIIHSNTNACRSPPHFTSKCNFLTFQTEQNDLFMCSNKLITILTHCISASEWNGFGLCCISFGCYSIEDLVTLSRSFYLFV